MTVNITPLSAPYKAVFEAPNIEDYLRLKAENGAEVFDVNAAARGLEETGFAIQIHSDGVCVAFCRVISDGGVWYYLTDETTAPSHADDHVRRFMVASLVRYFYESAPPGAYLMTISDNPALYRSAGLLLLDPPERGLRLELPNRLFQAGEREVLFPKPDEDLGPGYEVRYAMVDADTFLWFRKIGKLGVKDRDAVMKSVKRTKFAVQVLYEGECIAFCRTLGDGGLHYHIADGIVLPAHQASGIGKFFVRRLLYEFYQTAAPGADMVTFTWAPEFGIKSGFQYLPDGVVGLYAWQPV